MRLSAFFFEIVPLSGFFLGAQYYTLIVAAIISLILGLMVMLVFYVIEKRISKFQIFGICMSALFTFFAYSFNDDEFVKIQPTIFNGFFSAVLLFGIFYKKAMMKQFFGSQFSLNDETWYKLSLRWGLFFLFLTIKVPSFFSVIILSALLINLFSYIKGILSFVSIKSSTVFNFSPRLPDG